MSQEILPPGMRDPARRTLSSPALKDYATIEKYSRETNGEYTRFIGGVKVGGGNPLHYHTTYTETFSPTSGTLGLEVNGIITMLKTGEQVTVPIGVPHRFFNPSEDGDCKFTVEVRPGHEGFEKFLTITYSLANDGLCDAEGVPTDKPLMAMLMDLGDMRVAGAAGTLINPMMKGIAAYKRWMGEEEKMLKKYWYS